MRTSIYFALVFWTATLLIAGQGSSNEGVLALVGAKIYPSPDVAAIEDGAIVIRGGKVQVVGATRSISIPSDARQIDCKNLVITAGFWNSHVHILTPKLLHARESSAADLNAELEGMFNRWGFTTVFDLASILENTLTVRQRIETGELRGPRILTVGEPIWTIEPVYSRSFLLENHLVIRDVTTAADAIALVRDHVHLGADGIKLFTGSAQAGGKVANLPLAIADAAVKEAHKNGLPVFTHPQNLKGVEIAIDSGVDVLAHTVPQSPPWTEEFCKRLTSAHLALIPTLTLFDFEARAASQQTRDELVAKVVAELRAYSEAGGNIIFGTDIGYTDRYDTTLEFTLMARAGMNYRQILASLTSNPAKRFGGSGRIEVGGAGDLTVLEADPGKDVTAFSRVRYTIRNGKIIYRAKENGSSSALRQ